MEVIQREHDNVNFDHSNLIKVHKNWTVNNINEKSLSYVDSDLNMYGHDN